MVNGDNHPEFALLQYSILLNVVLVNQFASLYSIVAENCCKRQWPAITASSNQRGYLTSECGTVFTKCFTSLHAFPLCRYAFYGQIVFNIIVFAADLSGGPVSVRTTQLPARNEAALMTTCELTQFVHFVSKSGFR